jgi:hypothetical protein
MHHSFQVPPQRSVLAVALLVLTFALSLAPAALAAGKLDQGQLDPEWFGAAGEFHTSEALDYLWVKPGFSLQGKTIQLANWSDPVFLGGKRDSKDSARAFQLSEQMPGLLRGALSNALEGHAKVSREDGDVVLTGRFVDVNAGSKAAKWIVGLGAGSASATWDIKITDKATGELLAAIHHRAISGTAMTDIDDKIIKWMDEDLGPALRQDLGVYAGGKVAKQ